MLKVILDNLFSNNKDVSIKARRNVLYINTWSNSNLAIGTVLRRIVNNSSTYKDSSWCAWNFYAEPGGAITVLNKNIFVYSILDSVYRCWNVDFTPVLSGIYCIIIEITKYDRLLYLHIIKHLFSTKVLRRNKCRSNSFYLKFSENFSVREGYLQKQKYFSGTLIENQSYLKNHFRINVVIFNLESEPLYPIYV